MSVSLAAASRLTEPGGIRGAPLRVAALIDTVQVSGPGRQLAALAASLEARGVELRVVTFHRAGRAASPFLEYLERAGVGYWVLEERGPFDIRLLSKVRRLFREWVPDVVQTHGYKTTALAYLLRRGGARWPWIAFFHGDTRENLKVRLYHWLDARLLGAADRVIVMSELHRQRMSKLGDRVRVVHNACIPLPADAAAGGPYNERADGGSRIGVVGRLSPEKGVDVFLRACRELVSRDVPFTAFVAGDGPDRAQLEQLRDSLELASRVSFLGAIGAVHALYASLDLLVIPSLSEGLPNVLLEALRADVPVVATRVGAVPEVLTSREAGVIVPPGSASALAEGIVAALPLKDDPVAREARRAIVERFSVERRAAHHLDLYTALCPWRADIASPSVETVLS